MNRYRRTEPPSLYFTSPARVGQRIAGPLQRQPCGLGLVCRLGDNHALGLYCLEDQGLVPGIASFLAKL